MAEEATSIPPVDAPVPAPDASAGPVPAAQTNGEAPIAKEDEETAGKVATTEVNPPDGNGVAEVAAGPADAVDNATVSADAAATTPGKRTAGGATEHKKNKAKRKSLPVLRLECEPGQHYWARLKGHPPWPAIICDEQMLPESLLATRPVSTARPDGSLRDDFKEGGKNAKERTFPIMFLYTNEFAWMVNTALTPLDPAECETVPSSKMSKALQHAYKIAAEGHDLDHFKGILKVWQEEQAQIEKENRELEERLEREEEERRAKQAADAKDEADGKSKKKGKSRKSKGGDDDVAMEDADAPKSSKKRKKDIESDADGAKPTKTPKVTKINAPKTPNGDTSGKKSAKAKKKVVQPPKEEEEAKPQMTAEERMQQREKAVLYLRHRLQKGFLSRDQAPQESEMSQMAEFFGQLEAYENLEGSIIRTTKVHKVLKAIVKLSSIPKDEEFNFKKRSAALLEIWNNKTEADGGAAATTTAESTSVAPAEETTDSVPIDDANGNAEVAEERKAQEEPAKEEAADVTEKAEEAADGLDKKVETAEPAEAATKAAVGLEVNDTGAAQADGVEVPKADGTEAVTAGATA